MKFNKNQIPKNITTTHEGGVAYTRDVNDALMNFLFSSYLEDQYYESAEEQQARFIQLLNEVAEKEGYKFIGKLAHFARNEMGMRSIAELAAAWLNDKPMQNKREFYREFFHRPDDVGEVFSAVEMLKQKRSHGLVRGAKDYISNLNDFTLGKYKMNRKQYNMYDIINITHAWSPSIQKYKDNTLEVPDTWETKISSAENETQKANEWKRLVEEGKLGYLALLRNLRNIKENGEKAGWYSINWIDKYLVPQLTNEVAIRKSLVFPYHIYAAAKALAFKDYKGYNNSIYSRQVDFGNLSISLLAALDKAFRLSIANMPRMDGKSLIILDVSGSMEDMFSANSIFSIAEICAVYAAAIYVNNDADFVKFGTNHKFCKFSKTGNIFALINKMKQNDWCGYGTNIIPVFDALESKYDRIFLFSDMQVMNSYVSPHSNYLHYLKRVNGHSPIYSFDCGNYHSQLTNPNSHIIKYFTGLNEKIFKFIELYESGINIIDYINELYPY